MILGSLGRYFVVSPKKSFAGWTMRICQVWRRDYSDFLSRCWAIREKPRWLYQSRACLGDDRTPSNMVQRTAGKKYTESLQSSSSGMNECIKSVQFLNCRIISCISISTLKHKPSLLNINDIVEMKFFKIRWSTPVWSSVLYSTLLTYLCA